MPSPALPDPLRGVLFDMDGVLIDSGRIWYDVLQRVVRDLGGPEVAYADFAATFGQGATADMRQFFEGLSRQAVTARYYEVFPDYLDGLRLMPGAVELLDALQHRGLARAVVTNTPRDLAGLMLGRFDLLQRFDTVVGSDEAPEKPAPDMIHLALGRLGLLPGEVVYVGDSASDRGATRAAGVFMFGLGHPAEVTISRLDQLLPRLPGRV